MSTINVSPIPIYNVKVFLIQINNQIILIDTGIPYTEARLYQGLRKRGVDPSQIQTILLTHGHLDHIGCLANLKKISGAQVISHQSLESKLNSGSYEEAVPRIGPWKFLEKPVSMILSSGLKPVEVDLVVDGMLDLKEIGLAGQMLHTPGHSPGSCSILLENRICFLGDLIRETSSGQYDTGLFYHNREQILASLKKVASLEPDIIYLSHGTTITGEELKRFLEEEVN